jgi:hypothetical protein
MDAHGQPVLLSSFLSSIDMEAACKTLVTQRMKRSGRAWTLAGGQAILPLSLNQSAIGSPPGNC